MNTTEASELLGVAPGAQWAEVRAAHRRLIRRAHPDAGGSATRAALLNDALDVLRRAPSEPSAAPAAAAPAPVRSPVAVPADVDHFFLIDDRAGSLLGRLAEAGHEVGEVVFVDPHVGILEIVVGDAPNVGQLAVSIGDETAGGTPVSFTLDPLGVAPAPPIEAVVAALMTALRDV